jgi:hypothetical protein
MINGDICNEAIGGQLPHLAREAALDRESDVISTTKHQVHESAFMTYNAVQRRSSQRD